jgi:polar amino acid transport system permease protein
MSWWSWTAFSAALTNPYLWEGAWVTLWLTAVTMALGIVVGTVAALMNLSQKVFLTVPAWLFLTLWRGTPLLVQLIIIYTGLPQVGIRLSVVEASIIALGLHEGAYLAEIIRAGILSVSRGQFEAARAFGMTYSKMMRLIIMPQAMRVIIPPFGNLMNGLLKTTSLCAVISMDELLRRGQLVMQENFKVLEVFLAIALMYLAMTTVWGFIQQLLERRFGERKGVSGLRRIEAAAA